MNPTPFCPLLEVPCAEEPCSGCPGGALARFVLCGRAVCCIQTGANTVPSLHRWSQNGISGWLLLSCLWLVAVSGNAAVLVLLGFLDGAISVTWGAILLMCEGLQSICLRQGWHTGTQTFVLGYTAFFLFVCFETALIFFWHKYVIKKAKALWSITLYFLQGLTSTV